MSDLVFLDIETLGIELGAPIWEFAALRVDGATGALIERDHLYVRHDRERADKYLPELPPQFGDDYRRRYNDDLALDPWLAAVAISKITRPGCKVVGSNPHFDMQHLELLLVSQGWEPGWHYHPLDIPSMVMGYLAARGRLDECTDWRSNALSRAIGIEPDIYSRHTAEGDVRWTYDQWRKIVDG